MTTETVVKSEPLGVAATPLAVGAPRLRRRPLLVVIAAALVAAGALLGVLLWLGGAGTEVVVVRAGVDRGQVITAQDLATARVSVDPSLRTVPAAQLSSLVGKRAASDLVAGSLLTPDQVADVVLPAAGQSVVGIPVAAGLMPATPLRAGDAVRLVQTPGPGGEVSGTPVAIAATVVAVTPGDTQTVVDVVVDSGQAADLAARAATGKVAVVLDSRAR